MKKLIVLIGLLGIMGIAKGSEKADLGIEPRIEKDSTFTINGVECKLRTFLLGDYWTQCPTGFVIGSRVLNVRPPFASTIVRCARYEIVCEDSPKWGELNLDANF